MPAIWIHVVIVIHALITVAEARLAVFGPVISITFAELNYFVDSLFANALLR